MPVGVLGRLKVQPAESNAAIEAFDCLQDVLVLLAEVPRHAQRVGQDEPYEQTAELRRKLQSAESDLYRVRRDLDLAMHRLDEAYTKVDGKTPTGELRITKAD